MNPRLSPDSNGRTTLPRLEESEHLTYNPSRITDMVSEDGEASRPQSGVSSQPPRSQSPPSRPGPPTVRNSLISSSGHGTSRPTSAGSRISRTHIPSLTPHAFFRPMSSQKLQAQRGGRPGFNTAQPAQTEDGQSDEASQKRRSWVSNSTIRLGAATQDPEIPPSRGTEFTDPVIPDRGTSNASPTGNTTVRSLGESVRLLQDRSRRDAPSHLNLGMYQPSGSQDPPQKSPLSFRSGFLMPNKNEVQDNRDSRGHERLSSAASSPRSEPVKIPEPVTKRDLGKNYEYFTGNTLFCCGGRFQNSRDRPINIATGIFVILPGVLFFIYS
jgi:hypothetical protein